MLWVNSTEEECNMAAFSLYGDIMNFSFFQRSRAADDPNLIENAPYVVLDTELTGLNPKKDSVVSIGAVKMTGSKIELGQTFYRLVKPGTEFTPSSVIVHEITPSDVRRKPGIDTALVELEDFLGDSIIVGHFVSIDMGFLNKDAKRCGIKKIDNPVVDTCSIFDFLRKEGNGFRSQFDDGIVNKDLFSIARKYNIEVGGAHNALVDAYITAQVFQRFLRYMKKFGVFTIRDLLRVGRP